MMDLCLALLLFAMAVVVHILFCRRQKKNNLQAKAFIFIASFFLLVYAVTVGWFHQSHSLLQGSLWEWPFEWSCGVMFVLLIPVYLCFYVLTQLTSPSKKILQSLKLKGALSDEQIIAAIEEEDFINTRLNDLLVSGCVIVHRGAYVLTASGKKIALIIKTMQMITGRDLGG